jgi:outer membrane protein assembly factor BamE (lipoprotein component of BamABCDE complex)
LKATRLLAGIALVAAAAGCTAAREGIGDTITLEKITQLQPDGTSRTEVRKLFGKPDIIKTLDRGEEEYTYIQGRNDTQSWFLLSGYLIYGTTHGFSGNRVLLLRFKDETLIRFVASDGTLTIKKGYEDNEETVKPGEQGEEKR